MKNVILSSCIQIREMFQAIKCIFLFFAVLPISDCMAHEEKRNAIMKCTETQKGIDLIIGHGNQTQANINPLYFVPSIEIDNVTTRMTFNIISVKHSFDLFSRNSNGTSRMICYTILAETFAGGIGPSIIKSCPTVNKIGILFYSSNILYIKSVLYP